MTICIVRPLLGEPQSDVVEYYNSRQGLPFISEEILLRQKSTQSWHVISLTSTYEEIRPLLVKLINSGYRIRFRNEANRHGDNVIFPKGFQCSEYLSKCAVEEFGINNIVPF